MLLLCNSRADATLAPFRALISFDSCNSTVTRVQVANQFLNRSGIFRQIREVPEKLGVRILFDVTAVSAGFQLNALLAKRG